MNEKEMCYNGFCRLNNQGRMVLCVYVEDDGRWELDDVNCDYLVCKYKSGCEIGKAIDEMTR